MIDLSILIVHYNTPGLLRQTLKGIESSAPKVACEVIVVDNNPRQRIEAMVKKEFPNVRVLVSDRNLGFGGGMNKAMEVAEGRYVLVFNPDICLFPGALEELVSYMDAHKDIGMLAPQLRNPDGSVQMSCFRFMGPEIIAYRRVPVLRSMGFAKRAIDRYMMAEWDHSQTRDVDYVLGAAMCVRREALKDVGPFDSNFFVYFEDQDWCRRFWKAGWRVTYHPKAWMVHYHRRETAEGGFLAQVRNPLTRVQLKSALYYYRKYQGEPNPHA